MASPFPGMDPYIESCGLWGDFHDDLINEIKRGLAEAAPQRYFVRTAERSYRAVVKSNEIADRPFILEPSTASEPITLRAFIVEEYRESFVEVYEADPEQRLVTAIEVLSPSNKRPGTEGWKQYQSKRQSVLLGGVHLVEIDLLRDGQRPPMLDPWPDSPYTLLVSRAFQTHSCTCKVWAAHFQRPLPEIFIPLSKPDANIPLNLQPMIEAIYKRSRYAGSIDYNKPAIPPLSDEETKWLQGRLRERPKSV